MKSRRMRASARFTARTKYQTVWCPRCSASRRQFRRFGYAEATTRKQYKVLAANKYSATFYGRRRSFYCPTETRFIERILFSFFLFPRPDPLRVARDYVCRPRAKELPVRRRRTSPRPPPAPRPPDPTFIGRLIVDARYSRAIPVIPLIVAISNLLNPVPFTPITITSPLALAIAFAPPPGPPRLLLRSSNYNYT